MMNTRKNTMMSQLFGSMLVAVSMLTASAVWADSEAPAQHKAEHKPEHKVERQRKAADVVTVAVRELPAYISVGPTAVSITLTAAADISELQLSYAVEGSLRIDTGAPSRVQLNAQHQASIEVPVTVLSTGVHYLNVYVRAAGRTTAFAVKVNAGPAAGVYKRSRSVPLDGSAQGGGLVEMPAQETRHH